jgi:hypothetical protein
MTLYSVKISLVIGPGYYNWPISAVDCKTDLFVRRVDRFEKVDYVLCHICPSVAWNNSALTGRIFVKFCIWTFFENMSRKFKYY